MVLKVNAPDPDGGTSFQPLAGEASQSSPQIEPRTVALFDVLGFRQFVRTIPLPELSRRYHRIVQAAEAFNRPLHQSGDSRRLFPHHPDTEPWCKQYVFSDTIVMVADSPTWESTLRLLVASWRLFQLFLATGFPLRGGIAHGDMSVDHEAGILLGPAIVDAHELEAAQQWVGAAIHPSVLDAHDEVARAMQSDTSVLGDIFRRYRVPLKSGTPVERHTLNWRFNLVVEGGTRSLFPRTEGPNAGAKQANALAYAREVVESGRVDASGPVPDELRVVWVGGTEPPFKHGDDL